MQVSSKKAFTMIELIFVIVVIGILSAIAIPKLAATRDDATITKAIATIGAVRSSVATERQKRILRGDFDHPITSLHNGTNTVFDVFNQDKDGKRNPVLETTIYDCNKVGKSTGCWQVVNTNEYRFVMPDGSNVDFNLTKSRFTCKDPSSANCILLTN
nr:type II secretion system protein [Sulfurovum riftiae]